MKRYVFKLQRALDLKVNKEEQAKMELEQANKNFEDSLSKLSILKEQFSQAQEQVRKNQRNMNLEEIKRYQNFIPLVMEKIKSQEEEVESCRVEMEKVRATLIEIMKDRKMLEKLKSNGYQKHLKRALLEEQKIIDEMAANRFNKTNLGGLYIDE